LDPLPPGDLGGRGSGGVPARPDGRRRGRRKGEDAAMSQEEKAAAGGAWSFAASGLFVAQAALGGYIAAYGPRQPLPMHYNLDGQVDRWGSRWELVVLLSIAALVVLILLMARGAMMRRALAKGQDLRTFNLVMTLMLLILTGV